MSLGACLCSRHRLCCFAGWRRVGVVAVGKIMLATREQFRMPDTVRSANCDQAAGLKGSRGVLVGVIGPDTRQTASSDPM